MMSYGVDFQYFRQPGGDLLVKEMAIISLETDSDPTVLLFKAPYHWRRLSEKLRNKNLYIQRNLHGLAWDSGFHDYKELGSLIRETLQDSSKTYVIGDEKKKFMERFKIDTYDITDLGYLQFDTSKVVHFCSNHDFRYKTQCATQNVKMMKKFMYTQKEWEDITMEWEYV